MQTLINKIKSFHYFEVIVGILVGVIGLITIIFPNIAIQIISFGLGILLLCLGTKRMIELFSTKEGDVLFFVRFLGNLFFLFASVGLLFFHTHLSSLVCFLCGAYLVVDAGGKLFSLLTRRGERNASFWSRLILASLVLILGLSLILTPMAILNTAFRLVGVAILIEGVSTTYYAFVRLKENQQKKNQGPIETSFTDRTK